MQTIKAFIVRLCYFLIQKLESPHEKIPYPRCDVCLGIRHRTDLVEHGIRKTRTSELTAIIPSDFLSLLGVLNQQLATGILRVRTTRGVALFNIQKGRLFSFLSEESIILILLETQLRSSGSVAIFLPYPEHSFEPMGYGYDIFSLLMKSAKCEDEAKRELANFK